MNVVFRVSHYIFFVGPTKIFLTFLHAFYDQFFVYAPYHQPRKKVSFIVHCDPTPFFQVGNGAFTGGATWRIFLAQFEAALIIQGEVCLVALAVTLTLRKQLLLYYLCSFLLLWFFWCLGFFKLLDKRGRGRNCCGPMTFRAPSP